MIKLYVLYVWYCSGNIEIYVSLYTDDYIVGHEILSVVV